MAIRRKTIAYYSCDRCRFQEQGTEKRCPAGWRYLFTLVPSQEEQQPEIKALICPKCDEWVKQQLDAICVQERQEEEKQTDSRECTPFPRSPGSEQRRAPAVDHIRRSLAQAEEEKTDSEGTPFPRSPGSGQRKPSAIEPMRQLFRQGEEEQTDGSEGTSFPLPSGPEQPKLSPIEPIGRSLAQGEEKKTDSSEGSIPAFVRARTAESVPD
jgi:hypothetical protein